METAFEFERHRGAMFGLAYRMLGTVAEAEDIVQDAYLRWAAESGEVRSPRSWLMTVVARLCLDHLRSARARREEYVGPWLPEPAPLEEPADSLLAKESAGYAFQVVMQSLTPPERAVFLLREVFGEDYGGIAAALETTEANCRQLMTRARARVEARRIRFQAPAERQKQIYDAFLDACADGDVGALMGILAEDAVLYSDGGGKARAALNPIYRADPIARFFAGVAAKRDPGLTARVVELNGDMVLLGELGGKPSFVMHFLVREDSVQSIHLVVNPES